MNRTDTMITFLDALLLAERGEDPSKAIENQEKRGQANVVKNQRLPKKLNDNKVPRDIFWAGTTQDMDYETKRQITSANIEAYTRVQYEKMGIEIVSDADDLFWNVKLPNGWEVKATDHSMWNEVRDNNGRKRMTFFYKAAFYDRSAFSNLQTRFQLDVTHTADSDSDYEVWEASDLLGTVKEGDIIVYQTKCVPATGDYSKDSKAEDELLEELRLFMNEHWPEYENVHAYWD